MTLQQGVVDDHVDADNQQRAAVGFDDRRIAEHRGQFAFGGEAKGVNFGCVGIEIELAAAIAGDDVQAPIDRADEPDVIIGDDGSGVVEFGGGGRIAGGKIGIDERGRPVDAGIDDRAGSCIAGEDSAERVDVVDGFITNDGRSDYADDRAAEDEPECAFEDEARGRGFAYQCGVVESLPGPPQVAGVVDREFGSVGVVVRVVVVVRVERPLAGGSGCESAH